MECPGFEPLSDISRRIGLAASAMQSLDQLLKARNAQLNTKIRIYKTCILPILLYSSETWTLLACDIRRLESFHMQCQRRILGIRWFDFVRNDNVTKRTGLEPIRHTIDRRRLSLFGHVARLDNSTPANGVLSSAIARRSERLPPLGWKRLPGRPRRSWIQQIGDGTSSSIRTEWNRALGRGHRGSALRTNDVYAFRC